MLALLLLATAAAQTACIPDTFNSATPARQDTYGLCNVYSGADKSCCTGAACEFSSSEVGNLETSLTLCSDICDEAGCIDALQTVLQASLGKAGGGCFDAPGVAYSFKGKSYNLLDGDDVAAVCADSCLSTEAKKQCKANFTAAALAPCAVPSHKCYRYFVGLNCWGCDANTTFFQGAERICPSYVDDFWSACRRERFPCLTAACAGQAGLAQ
eukprot:TRINITY_DN1043_c0_g1_i1.p2 TRINITY_DN1043_c0_g1~~TRINITY_DN1043_c0_g1_i1.p2  ORF type:complete len:233 (-),score=58.93 TRINITY_DN1043_c0_g1_i1:299-937(-)